MLVETAFTLYGFDLTQFSYMTPVPQQYSLNFSYKGKTIVNIFIKYKLSVAVKFTNHYINDKCMLSSLTNHVASF